jgi:hypothetical protein
MANFSAEAGKIYDLRARLFSASAATTDLLWLLVNTDEDKDMVATSAFSISHTEEMNKGAPFPPFPPFPLIWLRYSEADMLAEGAVVRLTDSMKFDSARREGCTSPLSPKKRQKLMISGRQRSGSRCGRCPPSASSFSST